MGIPGSHDTWLKILLVTYALFFVWFVIVVLGALFGWFE